jgi:hypothetical protein
MQPVTNLLMISGAFSTSTRPMSAELDDLMHHEQRLEALRSHGEAWAACIRQGIDTDILADTALFTALHELIRFNGEKAALELVAQLKHRIECGEFEPERQIH